jgi:hypothetical protein
MEGSRRTTMTHSGARVHKTLISIVCLNYMVKRYVRNLTGHQAFRTIVLVMLLAIIALTAYVMQPSSKPTNARTATSVSSTTKQTTTSHTTRAPQNSPSKSSPPAPTSSGNKAASNSATTTGPCDSVLTSSQAKSVVGGSPSASSSNGITGQSADITTITCTYSSGSSTASIIEHKSSTPTGQHENDDQFGSSRPSGVTSVSGYGQVAYWQTSTGLNVLQNNNWYIISVSNNGSINESSSEQLAQTSQI